MLEAVIALAVMSMAAGWVFVQAAAALDRIATHAAFQTFQTGLLRLRAEAFAREEPLEGTAERLGLPEGWSLRLQAGLTATAEGGCRGGLVELVRADLVRARLVPAGAPCRYLRVS